MNTIYYYRCTDCGTTWQSDTFRLVACPHKCGLTKPYMQSKLTEIKEISKFWAVLLCFLAICSGMGVGAFIAFILCPGWSISIW